MKRDLANNRLRLAMLLIAVTSLSVVFACQSGYVKYASAADVPRVSVEEAKKEVDAGRAVIVDSRAESAYKQEHIANSINIPVGSPAEKFDVLPKGKMAIVYCSCATEGTSAGLAFQINEKGIANTAALVGGTAAWANAGFPMEGTAPPGGHTLSSIQPAPKLAEPAPQADVKSGKK